MNLEQLRADKIRFFACYYGQNVQVYPSNGHDIKFDVNENFITEIGQSYLLLKSLSLITDEEMTHVGALAHQMIRSEFKIVRRDKDSIHAEHHNQKINVRHHACLNFYYGTINANMHFGVHHTDPDKEPKSYKQNIGEIHLSDKHPIPYIAITDYLRQQGYAIPFGDYTLKKLQELEFVKILQ